MTFDVMDLTQQAGHTLGNDHVIHIKHTVTGR